MSHSGGRVVHGGFRVMGELELPLTPTAKVAHTTFLPHLTSWEPLFLHGHDHPPGVPVNLEIQSQTKSYDEPVLHTLSLSPRGFSSLLT